MACMAATVEGILGRPGEVGLVGDAGPAVGVGDCGCAILYLYLYLIRRPYLVT